MPDTDSAQEGAEHRCGAGADAHCEPHAPRAYHGDLPQPSCRDTCMSNTSSPSMQLVHSSGSFDVSACAAHVASGPVQEAWRPC